MEVDSFYRPFLNDLDASCKTPGAVLTADGKVRGIFARILDFILCRKASRHVGPLLDRIKEIKHNHLTDWCTSPRGAHTKKDLLRFVAKLALVILKAEKHPGFNEQEPSALLKAFFEEVKNVYATDDNCQEIIDQMQNQLNSDFSKDGFPLARGLEIRAEWEALLNGDLKVNNP